MQSMLLFAVNKQNINYVKWYKKTTSRLRGCFFEQKRSYILFFLKRKTIYTLRNCWVAFVCAYLDFIERTVVCLCAVVFTTINRTLNAFVTITIIHFFSSLTKIQLYCSLTLRIYSFKSKKHRIFALWKYRKIRSFHHP